MLPILHHCQALLPSSRPLARGHSADWGNSVARWGWDALETQPELTEQTRATEPLRPTPSQVHSLTTHPAQGGRGLPAGRISPDLMGSLE